MSGTITKAPPLSHREILSSALSLTPECGAVWQRTCFRFGFDSQHSDVTTPEETALNRKAFALMRKEYPETTEQQWYMMDDEDRQVWRDKANAEDMQ